MGKGILRIGVLLVFLSLITSSCDNVDIEVGCNIGEFIQAINDANSDSDHTRISLADDCEYALTTYDNQIDKNGNPGGLSGNTGFPVITTPITIEGNDSTITRAINAPEMRFFLIDTGGILTLEDMTLDDGLVQTGATSFRFGGAILNRGRFNLLRSVITNSYAEDSGGAIDNEDTGEVLIAFSDVANNASGKTAGGIRNAGDLEIREYSSIDHNQAATRGGGIRNTGSMTISDSEISNNEALTFGGGLYTASQSTNIINNVLFDSNISGSDGGGIYFNSSNFNVRYSTFNANSAGSTGAGGGILIKDSAGTIELETVFSANYAGSGAGVAILPDSCVAILAATFTYNIADLHGGGLYNEDPSMGLIVRDTSFTFNESNNFGGGISNIGLMEVTNSTINGNESNHQGGGIYNDGNMFELTNSTVSSNNAIDAGGGVMNKGTMEILFSTVAYNDAPNGAGLRDNGDGLQIKNSLFAYNPGGSCSVAGTLTALGDNLDDDGTCPGFTLTGNPFLGCLSDNGGPTLTHYFIYSSIAVDGVTDCTDIAGGTPITTDQRREPRPFNPQCDLGAFEAQSTLPGYWMFAPILVEMAPCTFIPDEDALQLISYHVGDSVRIMGRDESGGWLATNGKEGEPEQEICWIPSSDVELPEPVMDIPVIGFTAHPPEPGLEEESYDRCTLFSPETYSLTMMDIPDGTADVRLYVYMPEGVWGLEVEVPEDPDPWVYMGTLGDYSDEECSYEGYAGRVFCSFKLPESYLGSVREFNLYVNGCLIPVYTHSMVTIPAPPAPEPPESRACNSGMDEAACEAAGGTYTCGATSACECVCP